MAAQSVGTLSSYSSTQSDSKTGSSKSGASLTIIEEDFTKENNLTSVDLECIIQAERITKIIDEVIYKVKLSICLPYLLVETTVLQTILRPHHYGDINFIFEQYNKRNALYTITNSLVNISALEDIEAGELSLKNRLNPELAHLLYILLEYPELRPIVERKIEEMILSDEEIFYKTGPHQSVIQFLRVMLRFREQTVVQMHCTAAKELSDKIRLRKLEKSNADLVAKVTEYSNALKEELENFEDLMAQKINIIGGLHKQLNAMEQEAAAKQKKRILDSERQMVLASRVHAVKSELLKDENTETRQMYQTILHNHVLEEKKQRLRRCKCETQLLSWIQKYDVEMACKQDELNDFIDNYEEEAQKCEKLEAELEEQDKEYLKIVAEKEEEYHKEMEEKMKIFLLEHAARVIQNAWREVVANRAEKKRLKKILKKMQAEAAVAEAAARKKEAAAKKAEALAKRAEEQAKKAEAKAAKIAAKLAKAAG